MSSLVSSPNFTYECPRYICPTYKSPTYLYKSEVLLTNVWPLYAKPGFNSDLHRSYLPSQVSCTYVWPFNVKPGLNSNLGVPLYLSGFVCAYHLATRVRVPSTPSTFLSFKVCVLYLSCEKNENEQNEAGVHVIFAERFFNSRIRKGLACASSAQASPACAWPSSSRGPALTSGGSTMTTTRRRNVVKELYSWRH